QREGIAIAKAQGKYKGRQPIPIDEERFKTECAKWRAGQQTAKATMKKLGMKPTRFYRKVKEFGV
ncbi:MAG: recombinase family protein, partial [Ruminobacter sp.]|nr:recombinase family protein [Ruminobacter sp.]